MFFSTLEYLAVIIVIFLQYRFWTETREKINIFIQTIPDIDHFSLIDVNVFTKDLKDAPPFQLLENLKDYVSKANKSKLDIENETLEIANLLQKEMTKKEGIINLNLSKLLAKKQIEEKYGINWEKKLEKTNLTLLAAGTNKNEVMTKIIRSINTYLLRNKGAVSDFNLLRDIIQRNLDSVEEEINMTMPIPVYLGLMGTMAGIILGLFTLPDIGSEDFLKGDGINNLIGGIKIAMIASFSGLLFTVLNSGWKFKGAKGIVEQKKNDFFTFLQTELLPVLTENVNSGIIGLNRSIERFGSTFNKNVSELEVLMNKNHESLMSQQVAVETIQKMDITKFGTFNIKVLKEIKESVDSLERLSLGLKNIDSFVANSKALVERTSNVGDLSEKIIDILNESKQLQMFLNSHFSSLEDRGQIINNTVVKMDDIIDKSLKGLEEHIYERLQAVRDIKITAEDLLQKEFDQNRNILGKLKFLEPLKNEFSTYSKEGINGQKDALNTLNNLYLKMEKNNHLLELVLSQLQKTSLSSQIKSIFGRKKSEKIKE